MKPAVCLLLVLLLVFLVAPRSSADTAPLTTNWQIVTQDSTGNNTTSFQSDSLVNVTVFPPQTLSTGGLRVLVLWSVTTGKELARYTLKNYASGTQNASAPPQIVDINLASFSGLVNGATLLLQIHSPSDSVEFSTAISVAVNIQVLINQLKQIIYANQQQAEAAAASLQYALQAAQESNSRYFMVLGIFFLFLVAYVTRDKWLHRKKLDETKKSESEFEYFLEQFIQERYTPGDVREEDDGAG